MSSELVKCITIYADRYANTGIGKFIAMCHIIKEKNGITNYIIEEPVSVKNRWSCSYYDLKPLPTHLAKKYPVGFYTTGSHYKINKAAGYADYITSKEIYEKWSNDPNYDSRSTTWYSKGLELKKGISDNQTHLYHL